MSRSVHPPSATTSISGTVATEWLPTLYMALSDIQYYPNPTNRTPFVAHSGRVSGNWQIYCRSRENRTPNAKRLTIYSKYDGHFFNVWFFTSRYVISLEIFGLEYSDLSFCEIVIRFARDLHALLLLAFSEKTKTWKLKICALQNVIWWVWYAKIHFRRW